MKRTSALMLLCAMLLSLLQLPSPANGAEKTMIEQVVTEYFGLRETAINRRKFAETRDSTSHLSTSILRTEERRITHLEDMALRTGIRLLDARSSVSIMNYSKMQDGLIRVKAYEWTFFDYEENGFTDFFGMGVWHNLVLSTEKGALIVIDDIYDEGPLTGMWVGESINVEESDIFLDIESGYSIETLMVPASTGVKFSRSGVATYADQWVFNQANNGLWEQYYNLDAYKNYNPSGGDCANYASQSLYEGGKLPFVPSGTYVWWYDNKGKIGRDFTHEHTASSSWISTTAHRNFFSNYAPYGGVLVNNPTNSDIIIGNPVYYDWTGNGLWNHTTICVGTNTAGTPVVNSHNMDYYRVKWNYGAAACKYSTVKIGKWEVLSPNGGERWKKGTYQTIRWNVLDEGNVWIELSVNGGSSWETIFSSTPNDGEEMWLVNRVTENALIRVTSLSHPYGRDISNNTFKLADLTVTSPNGGEQWVRGSTETITWSSVGLGGNVRIDLSTNGGANWQTIISSAPNNGIAYWVVNSVSTTQARIRVVSLVDSTYSDTSNAGFTITEPTK
ncbi:MAG: amidase domain-containing protein [Peptococcaceae bacterium]|nr:amidase domain-containing protein [Peptococcaceae bacterium]